MQIPKPSHVSVSHKRPPLPQENLGACNHTREVHGEHQPREPRCNATHDHVGENKGLYGTAEANKHASEDRHDECQWRDRESPHAPRHPQQNGR